MITSDQSNSIVESLIAFHMSLKKSYITCYDSADDERMKIMLDYLIHHEKAMQDGLTQIIGDDPVVTVLDEKQNMFGAEHLTEFTDVVTGSNPSIERIQNVTLLIYQYLVDELTILVNGSGSSDRIQNLAEKETRELKKLARNFDFLEDM